MPAPKRRSRWPIVLLIFIAIGFTIYYFRPIPVPMSSDSVHKPVLAALIFDNPNQPELDFLSNAFTRETIGKIGQLCQNLDVIGHHTVVTYRNSRKTLQQIGRELGIDYVIDGVLAKDGDHIHLTVRFTRASDQTQLWTQNFDRPAAESFQIQNELVQKIASSLGVTINESDIQAVDRSSTHSAEARDLYFRGVDRCEPETPAALKDCIAFLEKALKVDPKYPKAHGALAAALLQSGSGLDKAEQHARQAIAEADAIPQAHVALAEIQHRVHKDDKAADEEFKKAIALNRSDPESYLPYAGFLLETNRVREAESHVQRALNLDPLAVEPNVMFGRVLTALGSYERATQQLEKTVSMDRSNPRIRFYLAKCYLAQGMYDDAIREFKKAVSFGPGVPEYVGALAAATDEAQAHRTPKGPS